MKLLRLKGVIDRVTAGVAAIVPDDGSSERYVFEKDLSNPREGKEVEIMVIDREDPNAVLKVAGAKFGKPFGTKMKNFSSLVRAMEKALRLLKGEVTENEEPDESVVEKIEFLEKGIRLFY